VYRALRVVVAIGSIVFMLGVLLGLRFLVLYVIRAGNTGNIQSLILAAVLLIVGFQILMIGLLADLIAFNRKILEEILYRVRKMETHPLSAQQEDIEWILRENGEQK
jgi:hypothetical protein